MSVATIGETQQRFLRAIVERIALERVAELHLFAPIRQGGVETGVAVVAAWPDGHVPDAAAPYTAGDASNATEAEAAEAPVVLEAGADESPVTPAPAAARDSATVDDDSEVGASAVADAAAPDEPVEGAAADLEAPEPDAEARAGDASPADEDATPLEGTTDAAVPSAEGVAPGAAAAPIVRHVVYTARYRLVLKGPDRGKWEVDVREEADAPLVTVDAVVRGVQRRAGDLADVERFGPEQLAIAVSDTPWRASE